VSVYLASRRRCVLRHGGTIEGKKRKGKKKGKGGGERKDRSPSFLIMNRPRISPARVRETKKRGEKKRKKRKIGGTMTKFRWLLNGSLGTADRERRGEGKKKGNGSNFVLALSTCRRVTFGPIRKTKDQKGGGGEREEREKKKKEANLRARPVAQGDRQQPSKLKFARFFESMTRGKKERKEKRRRGDHPSHQPSSISPISTHVFALAFKKTRGEGRGGGGTCGILLRLVYPQGRPD